MPPEAGPDWVEAEVIEHAVELGLVCDRSGQRRGAVVVPGDGEVAQPGGPVVVEVALDPELVGHRTAACSTRAGARLPAVMAAVFRWSRHREMPRPIRATPTGTASGRSNECGSTGIASVARVKPVLAKLSVGTAAELVKIAGVLAGPVG